MKSLCVLLVIVALSINGCAPSPTTPMTTLNEGTHRIRVVRIDVIEDSLAYDNRRGIYEITDDETGKKYIGVSGIGITEVGDHASSKSSRKMDER